MRSRNMTIPVLVVIAVVAVAFFGTVAYGAYAGLTESSRRAAQKSAVVTGSIPVMADTSAGTAATLAAQQQAAAGSAIAQPVPGTFVPGGPPFGQGGAVTGDGISGWGVAYREVTDAGAKADAALIKAAYQDAEKNVSDLGAATGNKVGRLLAMTDYENNQPNFRGCIGIGTPGKPVPQAQGANGSTGAAASSGSGSASNGTTVAPAPPVAPCQVNTSHYLVVWVFVRHALG